VKMKLDFGQKIEPRSCQLLSSYASSKEAGALSGR
jgi:hypothetical protein